MREEAAGARARRLFGAIAVGVCDRLTDLTGDKRDQRVDQSGAIGDDVTVSQGGHEGVDDLRDASAE
jgi:hypothetical protein